MSEPITIRIPQHTRAKLREVAALETIRLAKRVSIADLVRRGIDLVVQLPRDEHARRE